jgi:hypothetical protein
MSQGIPPTQQDDRQRRLQTLLYTLGGALQGQQPLTTFQELQAIQQQRQQRAQLDQAIQNLDLPEAQKNLLRSFSPQQQMNVLANQFNTPKERRIVEGADGFQYFADTGERVLPGVEKEKDKSDIKDEASLRKEFNQESKYFKGIAQSFGKVLATDPTAAGDVSLIFAYMKMLDPGSVVREGEQATAQNAAGVPARVINLYNRVVTGERLLPDQRADFRKQAQNIYDLALDDQTLVVARYQGIAESKGMKPDEIVFDFAKGLQPLIFKNSLESKTLEDLQQLDARKYNEEELEILAEILAQKIEEMSL